MTLASISDVRRYLGDDSLDYTDANIQPVLDATTEWVKLICDANWDQTPNVRVSERFYDVGMDDVLQVSDTNPIGVSVTLVLPGGNEFVSDLFDTGTRFDVLGDGKIQLRGSRLVSVPGLPYAWASRGTQIYRAVEVTYLPSGIVPLPVREAVALMTAANIIQAPQDIQGVRSESIGGYSYSLPFSRSGSDAGAVIPQRARQWLQPYIRHFTARVV